MGGTSEVQVWVALDPEGQICVVEHLVAEGVAGSSCAPPGLFTSDGVWVETQARENPAVRAWVFPDGYADTAPAPDGLVYVTPDLALTDPSPPP